MFTSCSMNNRSLNSDQIEYEDGYSGCMIKPIYNQGRGKFSNIKIGQLKTELNKAMNNQKERFYVKLRKTLLYCGVLSVRN